MSPMMTEDYDNNVQVTPAVMTLRALLSKGLESLPPRLQHALKRDDYSAALAVANKWYADKGGLDREAGLTYAVLLTGRDLCDEAMGVLRRTLERHAQDVSLQLAQVEALIVQGDYEAALALMEGLQETSTAEPRHWSFMGDMYLDIGAEDEALVCYEASLERGGKSVEVAFRLGHIYLERDEPERGAHFLEIAARLAPTNLLIWETAGDVLLEIGALERAIYAYERVLKQDPSNGRTWLYMGMAQQEAGAYAAAANAYERVVKLDPENAFGWLQLGHVQMLMGYPDQALHTFDRAARLEPGNVEALNGAVGAAFELGDIEQAELLAREAIGRDPDNAESQYNLAAVLLTLRRPDEALASIQKATENVPDDARFQAAQALALLLLNRQEEAIKTIYLAATMGSDSDPLLAFAEELIKRSDFEDALSFFQGVRTHDPTWEVVTPLLSFLVHGLRGDEDFVEVAIAGLIGAIEAQPQTIPVMWDFDDLERIALRLDDKFRDIFSMMLGVLEGRKSLTKLESMRKPL